MVRLDNIGAIFMASSITTTCHTKHVDIWYKYVNEYMDGVVVIVFINTADNGSNILTKNLSDELHEKHSKDNSSEALKTFLASKIFEVERKGAGDDVLH